MNTAIICGGTIEKDFTAAFLKNQNIDCIVAADRGLQFCYEMEIMPNYILGDYDSIHPEILNRYCDQPNVQVTVFPAEKDDTDTALAFKKALEIGSDRIYLLGALGGRMDHAVANIHLLKNSLDHNCKCEAYIVDSQNLICLIDEERILEKDQQFGKYVSFLPFTDTVEAITLEGFKYPLHEYTMRKGESIGVSNEIEKERCRISFKQGILLMIQSKDL